MPNFTPSRRHRSSWPGDHDVISLPHTVLIYQNIPHARLWIVPNSGHPTLIEHADEVNKKIDEFFTRPFKDFKSLE